MIIPPWMNNPRRFFMPKIERFSFLVDKEERKLITALAERLQRSQSDAVRFVVTEAVKELQVQKTDEKKDSKEESNGSS
jgi:hypothetical protein